MIRAEQGDAHGHRSVVDRLQQLARVLHTHSSQAGRRHLSTHQEQQGYASSSSRLQHAGTGGGAAA